MYGICPVFHNSLSHGGRTMMRPQALMEAVLAGLNWFLQPIGENLSKPQKKFLRDGPVGLLRAGRPVPCRMVREDRPIILDLSDIANRWDNNGVPIDLACFRRGDKLLKLAHGDHGHERTRNIQVPIAGVR